jgi:hypothetical protein
MTTQVAAIAARCGSGRYVPCGCEWGWGDVDDDANKFSATHRENRTTPVRHNRYGTPHPHPHVHLLPCIFPRLLRRPMLRTGASMRVLPLRRQHVVCGMCLCRSGVFSGFTTKVSAATAPTTPIRLKTRVFAPSPAAAHVHPRLHHPYHRLRDNAPARCDRLPVSAAVCGPSLCRSGVFSFFG